MCNACSVHSVFNSYFTFKNLTVIKDPNAFQAKTEEEKSDRKTLTTVARRDQPRQETISTRHKWCEKKKERRRLVEKTRRKRDAKEMEPKQKWGTQM